MRSHVLSVFVDTERDTADVTTIAADMARLVNLEDDITVTSVSVTTWDDDGDERDEPVEIPVHTVDQPGDR